MSDDNVIRVPRVTRTGPCSAVSIWPADETGVTTAIFHSLAQPVRPETEKKIIAPHRRKRGSVM
jgi:hypothetical protein